MNDLCPARVLALGATPQHLAPQAEGECISPPREFHRASATFSRSYMRLRGGARASAIGPPFMVPAGATDLIY